MHTPERGPDQGLFDLWSRFYDAPLVQRLTYRPGQDAVLRALVACGARRVLDVGCGTGKLAARIGHELPELTVTGCDFSRGMLSQASKRARRASLVQGDALRLPFAAASFDAVVSTEAFHWFPDQPAALREFHRVLAAKGHLLVALINPPLEGISRATRSLSRIAREPFFWPTRERMRAQVTEAGFRVLEQRFVLRLPVPFVLPTFLTEAVRVG